MWFDFAADDLSRPVVEELPQSGSWLISGSKFTWEGVDSAYKK
jgi:hypothetical protein